MKKTYQTAMLAFATCMLMGSSAFAQDWRGHHDNGNHYGQQKQYDYDRWDGYGRDYRYNDRYDNRYDNHHVVYRQPVVVIQPRDRVVIRDYYGPVRYIRAPVVYHSGYALPYNVRYQNIPPRLLNRLQPVPVGYEYVRVDNNILLINDATRLRLRVVAIRLLCVTVRVRVP